MVGLEFALIYEKFPDYYVIAKRKRTSPTKKFDPYGGYKWKTNPLGTSTEKAIVSETPMDHFNKNQFRSSIDYLLSIGPNRKEVISEQTKLAKEAMSKQHESPTLMPKPDIFEPRNGGSNSGLPKLPFSVSNFGSGFGRDSPFRSLGDSSEKLPITPDPSLYNG
ncbi:hypothetical protein AYI68_g6649 [Smittium mucronatum]|uniref:Uncharacterized protein n=1 Tax=Smittium mucronatum TaxID=133383 RepID=A0A1R0GQW4_9FUNG|nr:hypothetical protein AYI68_g6649 [Smittium mucronatum]